MNTVNKIVKESGINFTGSVLGNLLGYIWLVLITRVVSQDNFGSFTLAQSVIQVALIFVLVGTPQALDRYIPFYNSAGEPGKVKALIRFQMRFTVWNSAVVVAVLFASATFLAERVFSDPMLGKILRVLVFSIPLLSLTTIVSYTFAGYKELRYQVYLKQIIEPLLKTLFVFLVMILGLNILGWTWLYVLALLLTAAAGVYFLRTYVIQPLQDVTPQGINIREILTYSWPISISSVLVMFIGQLDYLILGIFRPSAEIAVYRVYIYLVVLLKLIHGSLARIYKPVVSELISSGNEQEVRNTYRRISKWVLMITCWGAVIIFLYGKSLLGLFFPANYIQNSAGLLILTAGTFLNAAFGPEGMSLQAYGNTKLILINSLVMVITNLGLGLWLVPDYGIVGAAAATAAALSLGAFLGFLEIRILHHMQPFSVDTLKIFLVGSASALLMSGIQGWMVVDQGWFVVLEVLILTGIYFLGLYITNSLDEVEWEIVRNIWKKAVNSKWIR